MRYILLLLLFALTSAGCSSQNTPIQPSGKTDFTEGVPIAGLTISSKAFDTVGIMGAYELSINPSESDAELIEKRISSIGESYIVDGISFFTISPCSSCLKIKSISLTSDGYVKLSFYIRHPFNPGDPLKPPTAINRLDLDIFDVALLVRPIDSTPQNYILTGKSVYTQIVAGNAGYTTELANVIDDPAALPFALVIDDTSYGSETFNEFPMGAEAPFDVTFMITGKMSFELFLTMGYGASAKKPERLNPSYFNPEFNRKNAWKVVVTPPNGNDPPTIANTWNDADNTATFPVKVEVFDWQIGANVDPELLNPDDVYAASEVSKVSVEIPGMTNSLVEKTSADSGSGKPLDPLIFILDVANQNRIAAGDYTGLVKVSDERIPGVSQIGGETDTLVTTPDGIVLGWHEIPEFATYQTFKATVVVGCGPITGDIISPSCPVTGLKNCQSVNFTVSASSGNGGDPIVLYEVDYDYDDITFDVDFSNTTGIFNNVGPFIVPSPCDENIPRTFIVAFRATDSCDPPNVRIFQTCDVTVDSCKLWIGDLSVVAINRGEGGEDPERITSVDLDWDECGDVVEYAIERGDGYNLDNWSLVGTYTTSFYKFQPTGNDLDDDISFRVIARAEIGGNPLTDSDPSEQVFVLFMCNSGYSTGNFWSASFEVFDFMFTSWWGDQYTPDVDNWPVGSNKICLGLYFRSPSYNAWTIARTPFPVPDLLGQKEAFCDGYWLTNFPWTSSMGMCVGSLSEPAPFGSEVCDFEPANTVYGTGFAYNRSGSAVNSEFCETNQDAWVFSQGTWTHVGYYLNDICDYGSRDYIAFGWANGEISDVSWISGWCDGFVFVVH